MTRAGALGRLLYGAFFAVALPIALAWWAASTAGVVPFPPIRSAAGGLAALTAGTGLMLWGIRDLMVVGGGLPMNAFPPPHYVDRGIYRWLRSPIYVGFTLVCAGAALVAGSPSGLFLVTPVVAMGCAALVFGFERHELVRRFGDRACQPPLLSLPRGGDEAPTLAHRMAVAVWVLAPWLVIYYAVKAPGIAPDAFETALPVERRWPVVQWMELVYASTYVVVPITVLLIRTQRDLRRFAAQAGLAIPIVALCWIVIPVVAVNRPFVPAHALGRLLAFEQRHSNGGAAFPAFHVVWGLIAAQAWAANGRATGRSVWAIAGWTWVVAMAISCLATGMHTVIDVAAAVLLYLPLRRYERTWEAIRRATERLANAWREWRFGPLRAINYGAFGAAAAGTGLLIAGSAAGPGRLGYVIWIGVCILVGAALWAQWLEGSSVLLRPFGWYGGMIGGAFGALTAGLAGAPGLALLAAFAVAAPWIQALGRCRCLMQGCCHGGPAPPGVGIRYRHPRSRVTRLTGLADVPIHATPLYSIAGNVVIGLLLARLRALGAPDAVIAGLFLIFNGLARFVEESYRAEPQTPIAAGLRLYQWLAIVSVTLGIVCTTLPSSAPPAGFTTPDWRLLSTALLTSIVCGVALGVDVPGSSRRFSRLAPVD